MDYTPMNVKKLPTGWAGSNLRLFKYGRGFSLQHMKHTHHIAWSSPVRGASLPRSIRQRGDSRPGRANDHDLMEHPGTGPADNSCRVAATSTDCDGDEKLTRVALLARATLSPPAPAPKSRPHA